MNKVTILLNLCALLVLTSNMSMASTKSSSTPPEVKGSWANKDEDGDGIADELDSAPFDDSVGEWVVLSDIEPNNSHLSANNEDVNLPFKVEGVISQREDKDTYRFTVLAPTQLSVVIHSQNSVFSPRAFILGKDNSSLQAYKGIAEPFGQMRFIASYQIQEPGDYHLSVSDLHFRGKQSFSYDVAVFEDSSVNGVPDSIENALGMSGKYSHDKDGDGIKDAAEFYIYKYDRNYDHDVDRDGIPNWQDEDADGDSLPDSLEGATDTDKDGRPAFVDLDSDADGRNDSAHSNETPLKDTDFDAQPDYRDVDDDGDLVNDNHDSDTTQKVSVPEFLSDDYIEISNINYNYQNTVLIPDLAIENESAILRINGSISDGWLSIQFDEGFINIPAKSVNGRVKFDIPYGARAVFFTDGSRKTNTIEVAASPKGIPIVLSDQDILDGKKRISKHVGTTLVIEGDYFYSDSLIVIGDKEYTPKSQSLKELTIDLNSEIESGELRVKTSYGYSNSVSLQVIESKVVNLAPIFENIESEIVLSSFTGQDHEFKDGVATLSTQGHFYSGFYVASKSNINMPFYMYLEGLENPFSPLHLAISSIWHDVRPDQVLSEKDSLDYYNLLSSMDEVLLLSEYINAHSNTVNIINDEYERLRTLAIKRAQKQIASFDKR